MSCVTGSMDIDGIKRCYIKDCVLTCNCQCGHTIHKDMSEYFFPYPEVGKEDTMHFYCDICQRRNERMFTIKSVFINIEIDADTQEGGVY